MKGTALIYHPDEPRPEVVELTSSEASRLGWLQDRVGGWIELVPRFTRVPRDGVWRACVAFCNEDGKRLKLPLNFEATALWNAALGGGLIGPDGVPTDVLVGPVVVLFGDEEFMASL